MSVAPEVLRRGAVVRIAGTGDDVGCPVRPLAYVDVRFDDGHVERRLGAGSVGVMPDGADRVSALQRWGRQTSDELAFDIACDVARHWSTPPPAVDHLPCEEVVFEWNQSAVDWS